MLYYYHANFGGSTNPYVKFYDPDRYDIVEKKEWRQKQLENRIVNKKELISELREKIKYYGKLLDANEENLIKLEKELKELE